MKSDLQIIRIPDHSSEWYEFRKNGIGGSDMGTVLGLNKYDSVVRLFHEKIGSIPPRTEDNNLMFWGRQLEDEIAKIWSFYDGTFDGYIENYKNNKVIRSCRNINGYVVNPKYPWLFGSLDRVQNISGGVNLLTKQPLSTEAVLECKTLTYWASQIWQDGIPIYYLIQVHQYMIIIESDYAEIAILKDGNNFIVEKIQRDDSLCEQIIEISKAFWYNRILPAQDAYKKKRQAEMEGNYSESEKYEALVQRLEPDPDNSEAYREFMEERFLKQRESMDGTIKLYEICKKDKVLSGISNLIEDARNGLKNHLVRSMSERGVEVIDFGNVGSVTWSERKGTKKRTLTNRIKEKPSEDQLLKEFNKIDLNCY